MSANFYNAAGNMVGFDLHDYWGCIPPDPLEIQCAAISIVDAKFSGDCGDEKTRLAKVTSNAKPTLQGGFACKRIFHWPDIPIPPLPPHPREVDTIVMIWYFSSSTAVLKRATVTGGGAPLAVCIHGSFGVNLNCGDPIDTPTGFVKNVNSVMTEPSTGDFVSAWASAVGNGIIGTLTGLLLKGLFGDSLLEPIKKAIEDKIKEKANEYFEKYKDKHMKSVLASIGVTHV